MRFYDWKIQHVYYPSEQITAIVFVHVLIPNPVKYTIDDISDSSAEYKGYTDQKHGIGELPDMCNQVPEAENRNSDSEYRKCIFSLFAEEFHSEGHTFILCKMQNKPITGNLSFGMKNHVVFNPILEVLVKKNNKRKRSKW
jgi:hypothetical protein